MKYALYSDIHAHMPQLEAVQEAVAKENVDREIIIGDLVMAGPQPAEVVARVMSRPDITVIQGNTDLWAVRKRWETHKAKSPHLEWMYDMARMTSEMLSQEQLDWMDSLPFSLTFVPEAGHEFDVFHGTPHEIGDESALPLRLTDDEVMERLAGVTAEVVAFGHVHGPYVRDVNGIKLVCAAGVGFNWDGDPRPAYALVEYEGDGKWHAEIKRVDFDVEAQAKACEDSWIVHPERIAVMVREARFWNPDQMPH